MTQVLQNPIQSDLLPTEPPLPPKEQRRLSVPIGGDGWFWAWAARFALVFSFFYFSPMIPQKFRMGITYSLYITRFPEPWFSNTFGLTDLALAQTLNPWFFAATVATVWMLIHRSRRHETVIKEISRVIARYGLAAILASYGLEKVIGAQGSWAYLPHFMTEPYATLVGGTTLMTWLAHSTWYEQFGGWVELACTFLLPFRRTATLGAVLALASLINIAIVNTGHWGESLALVPWTYGTMAIYLLLPYVKRFSRFFTGQAMEPMRLRYLTPPSWYWGVGNVAKTIGVSFIIYSYGFYWMTGAQQFTMEASHEGLYTVERFERNGRLEPIAREFPERWREVAIGESFGDLTLKTVDGTRYVYRVVIPQGASARTMDMYEARKAMFAARDEFLKAVNGRDAEFQIYGEPSITRLEFPYKQPPFNAKVAGKFHFTQAANDRVTLQGTIDSTRYRAELKRIQLDTLPFHAHRWYPKGWRAKMASWAARHDLIIY
jgi:hypothetical protein